MHVDLDITTSTEYFERYRNSSSGVQEKEIDLLNNIIACEVSVYLLRRSTGHCGINADTLVEIRRNFINEYNGISKNGDYIENSDFY